MRIFSEPGDYTLYRDLLAERLRPRAVKCSAYCLMPNHMHLVLTSKPAAAQACLRDRRGHGNPGALSA